jgi:hypothetical protein
VDCETFNYLKNTNRTSTFRAPFADLLSSLPTQGRILVKIVGEVETNLGEVQRSSSRPPWKLGLRTGQSQRRDACNFHIALNFLSSCSVCGGRKSSGRFVKYECTTNTEFFRRVFSCRVFIEETQRNTDYSPKIYIIERLRKIGRGR